MNLTEKTAPPRTLNPNGWYIQMHNYIGWDYSKRNFCPFFWKTALGCALIGFIFVWRLSIAMLKIAAHGIGWCLGGVHKAVCWLIPHKLLNFLARTLTNTISKLIDIYEIQELKRLERLYGHYDQFAMLIAYRLENAKDISPNTRSAYYKTITDRIKITNDENQTHWTRYQTIPGGKLRVKPALKMTDVCLYKNDYKPISDAIATHNAKHQAIFGSILLFSIACVLLTVIYAVIGTGGMLSGLLFVSKWLLIVGGVIATIVATVAGAPLVWGYWKDVVMQKYCPSIIWEEETQDNNLPTKEK